MNPAECLYLPVGEGHCLFIFSETVLTALCIGHGQGIRLHPGKGVKVVSAGIFHRLGRGIFLCKGKVKGGDFLFFK